jgi:hypothetical protein
LLSTWTGECFSNTVQDILTYYNYSRAGIESDKNVALRANVKQSTLSTWKGRGQHLACLTGGGKLIFSFFDKDYRFENLSRLILDSSDDCSVRNEDCSTV